MVIKASVAGSDMDTHYEFGVMTSATQVLDARRFLATTRRVKSVPVMIPANLPELFAMMVASALLLHVFAFARSRQYCANGGGSFCNQIGMAVCTDGCAGGTCGETHVQTFVLVANLAATATAPAVANPYLNATTVTAPDTGGGVAVQLIVPATILAATALAAANPHLNVTTSTTAVTGGGEAAQRVRGHFVPCHCTDAEFRAEDPRLQRLTDADRQLCSVYGDTIHQNDGTHFDGRIGVAEDAKWQRFHLRVAACNLPVYNFPNGRWAHCPECSHGLSCANSSSDSVPCGPCHLV